MHLSREADVGKLCRVDAGGVQQLAECVDRGLPPVLRFLLSPQGAGGAQVLDGGTAGDAPFGVDEERLGARGADVNADQECLR